LNVYNFTSHFQNSQTVNPNSAVLGLFDSEGAMTSDAQASPPSPSASFYDLSDDEEGEYNTIMHTRTGRGVKLLYSKSKVGSLVL